MTTAAQYQQQIDEILGIRLAEGESYQWDYETAGEAESALADIRATQKKLEEVRRALVAEMKAIRDDFRDKMANAAAGSSTAMSLLGRKQKAGQMKADAKRQLRLKRNETLAPYNEVKGSLDRVINDLGKQATSAQRFADSGNESRPAGQAGSQTAPERQAVTLQNFYFDTPPAGSQMVLEPTKYSALEPIKPPESLDFELAKPAEPQLQEAGLRGIFSGGRREQVEEENRRLLADYERQTQEWEQARASAEASLVEDKAGYQASLEAWRERKDAFEAAEAERLGALEQARKNDPSTMRALLGRRLESLAWPPELELEFATEYFIEGQGALVRLEVCLPDQEQWPDPGYIDLVHAIGFRLTGETFYVLPGLQTVLLSGFVEDPGRPSRYDNKITLYSSRVSRDDWGQVDFDHIETLDMVSVFNLFETRRQISEGGRLAPVKPFRA